MSFTCRSLLGRIKPFRTDIDDGQIDYVIQETARKLTKDGYLMRIAQVPFFIPAKTNNILFTPNVNQVIYNAQNVKTNFQGNLYWSSSVDVRLEHTVVAPCMDSFNFNTDIHRIMGLRASYLNTVSSSPATFLTDGYYDALADGPTPLPDPTTTPLNSFVMVVIPAQPPFNSPFLSNITGPLGVGDILQVQGNQWAQITFEQYWTIPQSNDPTVVQQYQQPQATSQYPNRWTQGPAQLFLPQYSLGETTLPAAQYVGYSLNFYPQTLNDMVIQVIYNAVPIGDFSDVELPYSAQAREAIICGALSELLSYPGQQQNLNLSELKKREYMNAMGALRSLGTFGYGGSPIISSPSLTNLYGTNWNWNYGLYMP